VSPPLKKGFKMTVFVKCSKPRKARGKGAPMVEVAGREPLMPTEPPKKTAKVVLQEKAKALSLDASGTSAELKERIKAAEEPDEEPEKDE
jgi:hypothetical protein